MNPKRVAILGSTGSIGTQALEVLRACPGAFAAEVLAAGGNADLLIQQAIEFKPNAVVIGDETRYAEVRRALDPHDIKVFAGTAAIEQVVEMETVDMVLAGIVGYAGLASTLNAIRHGKPVALANKETLVVAGELVTKLAREKAVNLYPVDSEHSAIFQCMAGEWQNPIEKIILTASGGPFRGKDRQFLASVTKKQALNHPNWVMGAKITIDSATLMNKGLEVIEARWLFNVPGSAIDVVVHPESIVHSLVQFGDGSIKAQLGLPDMKLPIQYALSYPNRITNKFPRFDFARYPTLKFELPDRENFRCLPLAYEALSKEGNMACTLNAANEIAVDAFLKERIGFMQISDVVERTMVRTPFVSHPSYDDYVATDNEARRIAAENLVA
jgi:1-deoxy-D-xylulose-5-phosphate reductoisomerase